MSDDDNDLRRAIALSLGRPDPGTQEKFSASIDLTEDSPPPKPGPDKQPAAWTSLQDLDRAQMERDRLARKRKRDGLPLEAPETKALKSLEAPASKMSADYEIQFPTGVVKKTFCRGSPRRLDDISLEEVLHPDGLRMAILSAFMWDVGWVFSHLDWKGQTKVLCVMQAKDEMEKADRVAGVKQVLASEQQFMSNIRFCFPSMAGGVNCMHSKLMVLSYEKFLRIAVPTANLVPYDWGEDGTMENSVFIIDLPRHEPEDISTQFGQELVYFLKAKGIDDSIINSLRNFDFNATEDMAFVHTIGGSHLGATGERTGHPGLSRAVRSLGLQTDSALEIDFVTSSVGSLNMKFLSNIYRACRGDDFSNDAETKKSSKKSPWNQTVKTDGPEEVINDHFRIYFPTHETVTRSIAGSAGTICIQSKYYNNPLFPRSLLRDCKSVRPGVLMHNKIIFVRPLPAVKGSSSSSLTNSSTTATQLQAWAYIGSANCSESAWGNKVVRDRATKQLKLFARNWECGVIVKCRRVGRGGGASSEEKSLGKENLQATFNGTVPVPMQTPGEQYNGRKPWYFMGEE